MNKIKTSPISHHVPHGQNNLILPRFDRVFLICMRSLLLGLRNLRCSSASLSTVIQPCRSNLLRCTQKDLRTPSRKWVRPHHDLHQSTLPPVDDTIYALSTVPGRSAIAVIRISGPACLSIYAKLCPDRPKPKPRAATLRKLISPEDSSRILDAGALLLYFPTPNSVTGEDVLELHVHGGPAIVRSVLEAIAQCSQRGAVFSLVRPAEAGEFTKRAFYNDRIDLTEVEALGEALVAETEQQRRLAISGATNKLTQRYEEWRSMLLHARGELEALIDFSEDQHFDESPAEFMSSVSKQVLDLKKKLELHVINADRGELLRNGINAALLGPPNAGKSSLLNRIVGREAAIVSAEAGTTRDIVDVSLDLKGWLVRFGDMAGLRTGSSVSDQLKAISKTLANTSVVGEIEQEGIRRARERALQSDLVIVLLSLQLHEQGYAELAVNAELLSAVQECSQAGKDIVFVVNKVDLLHNQTCLKKNTISRLLSELMDVFPMADPYNVFCLSCKAAEAISDGEDPDPGGLQTFIEGLVRKFGSMTQALAGTESSNASVTSMSPSEAQSYWAASLSVTHRQSQFLHECLIHLNDFLNVSTPSIVTTPVTDPTSDSKIFTPLRDPQPPQGHENFNKAYFDTGPLSSVQKTVAREQYHIDNHADIVGEINALNTPFDRLASKSIPYSWAKNDEDSYLLNEEIDIVTAAEHLRAAADCLGRLTGRGDGTSSGMDVEDVLGVVFEK